MKTGHETGGASILVVDDDAGLASTLKEFLASRIVGLPVAIPHRAGLHTGALAGFPVGGGIAHDQAFRRLRAERR